MKGLTVGQHFWRELACKVVGHRWKFPKRRYVPLTADEYEAAHRATRYLKFPPNPYWQDLVTWSCKCRRCRRVSTEWPTYPLQKEVWWMVCSFFSTWGICFKDLWDRDLSLSQRLVHALVIGPLFAFEQVWLGWWWCQWGWPALPGAVASDLCERLWKEQE
ncbi:MAG: hypothetical protein A2139_14805 [Desulfobacca sp. RBG_16_60_12]|nr:MAG: hypothetical protein A2139_14805 [Desulfobacca sp. RBG_16_60_12]